MSAVTMKYRRQDADGDMVAGQGLNDFFTGAPAVAQAILTWMLLLLGEWWEDTAEGLPLWQKMLGQGASKAQLDLIVTSRILSTPTPSPGIITGISSYYSSLNSQTRAYAFQAVVITIFGPVTVTNIPGGTS